MERQAPFLKSVLQEADNHKRQELLQTAKADQINAIGQLVMNTIRESVKSVRKWRKVMIFLAPTTRPFGSQTPSYTCLNLMVPIGNTSS